MSKDAGKKVALSALIAAGLGYVFGLLTAPKSGKETRKDIIDGAVKAKKDSEKKLKEVHSQLHSTLIDIRKQGDKLTGKAKIELENALDSASAAKEKVREVLSALHDGDADDPELKKALKDAKAALSNLEKYITK